MDIDLNQPARARAFLRLDRHAVELVGDVKIPRQLHRGIAFRDALVVKPVHSLPLERPGDRTVLQGGLVVGGHIVDLGIIAVVGEFRVPVQVHALDDARRLGDAVGVEIDVYCFVGLDLRRGGDRTLRQDERQYERRSRDPAQFI